MKQKYYFYSSILSMMLTAVLLVFVCLAWYVTNKEAEANGIVGHIVKNEELIDSVEYFKSNQKDESGNLVFNTKITSEIEMGSYNIVNELDSEGFYPQRLIAIHLKKAARVKVEATTSATRYLGAEAKDGDEWILKKEGNSLSSVISFYIPSVSVDGDTITTTFSEEDRKSFVDLDTRELQKNITLSEATMVDTVYIVMDYFPESIEYIYSINLGNDAALNPDTDPTNPHAEDVSYDVCDFYFSIKGASA